MFRIGLTLVLVLALAAGPWLCCCTAAQFAAVGVPWNKNVADNAASGCCCDTAPQSNRHDASHGSPARSCPCHKNRPSAAGLLAAPGVVSWQNISSALDESCGLSVVHLVAVPSATNLPIERELAFPFFTGRDILSSLHILRC
jgi:hypothetical protein